MSVEMIREIGMWVTGVITLVIFGIAFLKVMDL